MPQLGYATGLLRKQRVAEVLGDIRILWHKSIGATPVGGISSDRICGIRFSVDDGARLVMSIIGVYLPCLDQGLDCYKEHLVYRAGKSAASLSFWVQYNCA